MAGVPKEMLEQLSKEDREEIHDKLLLGGLPISSRTRGVLNDMYVSNPDIDSDYEFETISVQTLMVNAVDHFPYQIHSGFGLYSIPLTRQE